jgi:uncharacterized protein (TIGR02646 family)
MRRVECSPWSDTAPTQSKIDAKLAELAAHFADPAHVAAPKDPFPDDLYKRFRDRLLEAFHKKCAYCEITITGQGKGDVEHFRPKGAVQDENGRPVLRADGSPHPGYWWLAFQWGNLLPACRDCNNAPNKGMRFPVEGPRSEGPPHDDTPLLINPLLEDPEPYLRWNPSTGKVIGRGAKGKKTVEVLRFTERTDLQDLRQQQREHARTMVRRFYDRTIQAGLRRQAEEYVRSAARGELQFSAYLRAVIRDERDYQVRRAEELRSVIGE